MQMHTESRKGVREGAPQILLNWEASRDGLPMARRQLAGNRTDYVRDRGTPLCPPVPLLHNIQWTWDPHTPIVSVRSANHSLAFCSSLQKRNALVFSIHRAFRI